MRTDLLSIKDVIENALFVEDSDLLMNLNDLLKSFIISANSFKVNTLHGGFEDICGDHDTDTDNESLKDSNTQNG